jgi:hypothetical protein
MTTTSTTDLRGRFQRLAAEWKEQSRYLSNTAQMAMLKPYQRIIGMGLPAVPFILEELRREPNQWFWALEAITEENPVPPDAAGNVRQMAQAGSSGGRRTDSSRHDSRQFFPATHPAQPPRHKPAVPRVPLHHLGGG